MSAASAVAEIVRASTSHAAVGTKSTATDVVTATDHDAERVAREHLADAAPGSLVLGEEGGHAGAGSGPHGDLQWIVDPLDGTVNFVYGLPITSVSIAVAAGGRAVAGAVVDVQRNEVFSAELGRGAWCDDRPIRAGDCTDPSLALVATGFAYDADRRREHGATVARLLADVRDIRAFGSAALELCWVAAGRLDAYLERDIKPWDHAAGALIAAEAGAEVELPCYENDQLVLAANPVLSRRLRELLTASAR